jgi:hypothetical protein
MGFPAPQCPGSHPSRHIQDRPSARSASARRRETLQRLAAGAGTVAHFQRAMMVDIDQAAKVMREEEMQGEIEDFIEGFKQPTYRGMRVNGPGAGLVKPARLERDVAIVVSPNLTPFNS